MTMRIAYLVSHLSGTGHLVRVLALARAAQAAGASATVISGGRPLHHLDQGGIDLHQLPPLLAVDGDYRNLHMPEGETAGPDYLARRRHQIVEAVTRTMPHALVTELYPLGRRTLAPEFDAAIEAVRRINPNAVIAASVRDVPEPKPKRLAEVAARLHRDFDALLVHGDVTFLPLWESWPLPEDLRGMVHHTGYVRAAETCTAPPTEPNDTVLVSVGGGALGRDLLQCAAEATCTSSLHWHLLVGGSDAAAVAADLSAPAGRITAEPVRPDYRHLLAEASVSVSLAGYNTALDIAGVDTPALLCPSIENDDREQTIRATHLARHPGITCLTPQDLTPERLAAEVEILAAGPRRSPLSIARQDGAAKAVAILERLVAAKEAA